MIYYMQNDNNGLFDYTFKNNRVKIQSIIFFNKLFTGVESRY
jgi:hypothetical protein